MKRVAAIDIGTNSVRLLVAEVDGTSPRDAKVVPLDRRMRITRLGQGVDSDARARARGDRTHRRGAARVPRRARRARRHRRARHRHQRGARRVEPRRLLHRRARRARRHPRAAVGRGGGALSFLGATADLDAPAPYLVVDIGGGSTEFVLGTDAPTGLVSLDMGCVRITEQFLESDPPAPEELSNAVAAVRDLVADVPRVIPGAAEAATLVGLAGTVTTVAAIELGLPEYDPEKIHHFRADARRGRRRVPHARHRDRRAARAQPRARTRPGRRDRRRRRGARRHLPRRSASTRCWSARPTSSTVWCAARSWR